MLLLRKTADLESEVVVPYGHRKRLREADQPGGGGEDGAVRLPTAGGRGGWRLR
jgi:hypothetical protein